MTRRLRAQHRGAGLGVLPHHGKLPALREEAELPAASLVPQAEQGTGDGGSTGRSWGCRGAPGFCTDVAEADEASVS